MKSVYVVLPAFNEERSIGTLLNAIRKDLDLDCDLSIIVVNDGSSDNTGEIVDSYAKSLSVTQVKHERNMGLGEAVKTGIKAVLADSQDDDDIAIFMDADNTHPPRYCNDMVEKIAEGWDIVIASRYRSGSAQIGVPLFRRFLSLGARILFRLTIRLHGVRDYTCGYRAYRVGLLREAYRRFGDDIITRNGFACTDEILVNLASITQKITEVPFVLRYDRKLGKSKIRLWLTACETLKMLIGRPKDKP